MVFSQLIFPVMLQSFSDEAAQAIKSLIEKQADASFIKIELEGYDTFVVEAHDGSHIPYTDSDAVSETAIFSFTSKKNGDTIYDPQVVVAKVDGDWYPFNWRTDRSTRGAMDIRLARVEDGSVTLAEESAHSTAWGADLADPAEEQYAETLEYCADWFPGMAARYSDVEPA